MSLILPPAWFGKLSAAGSEVEEVSATEVKWRGRQRRRHWRRIQPQKAPRPKMAGLEVELCSIGQVAGSAGLPSQVPVGMQSEVPCLVQRMRSDM